MCRAAHCARPVWTRNGRARHSSDTALPTPLCGASRGRLAAAAPCPPPPWRPWRHPFPPVPAGRALPLMHSPPWPVRPWRHSPLHRPYPAQDPRRTAGSAQVRSAGPPRRRCCSASKARRRQTPKMSIERWNRSQRRSAIASSGISRRSRTNCTIWLDTPRSPGLRAPGDDRRGRTSPQAFESSGRSSHSGESGRVVRMNPATGMEHRLRGQSRPTRHLGRITPARKALVSSLLKAWHGARSTAWENPRATCAKRGLTHATSPRWLPTVTWNAIANPRISECSTVNRPGSEPGFFPKVARSPWGSTASFLSEWLNAHNVFRAEDLTGWPVSNG